MSHRTNGYCINDQHWRRHQQLPYVFTTQNNTCMCYVLIRLEALLNWINKQKSPAKFLFGEHVFAHTEFDVMTYNWLSEEKWNCSMNCRQQSSSICVYITLTAYMWCGKHLWEHLHNPYTHLYTNDVFWCVYVASNMDDNTCLSFSTYTRLHRLRIKLTMCERRLEMPSEKYKFNRWQNVIIF